jgi:DNA-binding response OmpR family regulator
MEGIAPLQEGRLKLEKSSRQVWIEDQELLPPLSASQFQLLEILYEHQDRVIPRNEIIAEIWGADNAVDVSEQALDALVRRLRDRLGAIDTSHPYIVTIRGHGLRLDNPPK